MITVGMNYDVIDGKQQLFEDMFEKVVTVMNATAGHVKSRLYRDVRASGSYLIISEWNDRTAFDQFVQSARFRGVTNWGKEQILAGRPRHEIYGADAPAGGPRAGGQHPGSDARCPVAH